MIIKPWIIYAYKCCHGNHFSLYLSAFTPQRSLQTKLVYGFLQNFQDMFVFMRVCADKHLVNFL